VLHVHRTVQRIKNTEGDGDKKTKVVCLTPKSRASERKIPLPDFIAEFLKEHKEAASSEYVVSLNGCRLEPRAVQRRFKRLLVCAEIKDVNFHAGTRHTFATRALEKGFDIKTLSEILGHSSVTFTLIKYAHVLDEHKRRNMELLASLFD
jgi:integrase